MATQIRPRPARIDDVRPRTVAPQAPRSIRDSFRPDIEGLRAVAVLLVALCHAGVPGLAGGFIGVDVFYVISGYLITSLLIRGIGTRSARGTLKNFYARRVRRLLPAATLVLVATVFASYHYLGFLRGDQIARDGIWSGLFSANLHFALNGTNYLAAQEPPSPLQHFWSLAVEEQFYLVWPAALLLVAAVGKRFPLRVRLGAVLVTIFVASLTWSIMQTGSNPTWAYFSPLTRAWELALGALIVVCLPLLASIPAAVGAAASWLGLAGIIASAFVINASTPFPGAAALAPVLATALVIMGGTIATRNGAQAVLGLRPLQWLGMLSYSFYLWHWPILIIAAQHQGTQLSVAHNLVLLLVALAISAATFFVLEHPVRSSRFLRRRELLTLALGCTLVAISLSACYWTLAHHAGPF